MTFKNSLEASADRARLLMEHQGFLFENYPRCITNQDAAMVSGTVYFMSVGLLGGDLTNGVCAQVNAAGADWAGVGMKIGLYSRAQELMGSTGDVSAEYSTTGIKSSQFRGSAAQETDTPVWIDDPDGCGYVALLAEATTPPSLGRMGEASLYSGILPGATLGSYGVMLAQADLPAQAVIDFADQSAFGFWVALN